MKKALLTLIITSIGYITYAQNNIFQSGSNVGIGTTNPTAKLEINSGTGLGPFRAVGPNGYILVDNVGSGESYYQANTAHRFQGTSGTEIFTILGNGNVGIGTTNPVSTLTVNGNLNVTHNGNYFSYDGIADVKLQYTGRGSGGRAMVHDSGNKLTLNYGGDFTGGTSIGTNVYFSENNTGTSYVYAGNFAIGTSDTKGYKLAVAGTMIAEQVTVKLQSSWPDYVFKKGYILQPLSSVKSYIDQNHHLPEMPSEQDIATDGLNLGEMSKLLTKKVEELTLYLIKLETDNQEAKKENELLKAKLEKINKKLAIN